MSYCKEEGKDRIMFLTKEGEKEIETASLPEYEEEDSDYGGVLNTDGSINWACPCVGSIVAGPCGYEFREAYSCTHEKMSSGEDIEGCEQSISAFVECMKKQPELYGVGDKEGEDEVGGFPDITEGDGEMDSKINRPDTQVEERGELESKTDKEAS